MALKDFWTSVRAGSSFLLPRVISDSPRSDYTVIWEQLKRSVIWLTPSSVSGFAESDFEFLPESERSQLARSVAAFRAVAVTVPPRGPAPAEAIAKALPHFLELVKLLEFDRFADPEAYRIGKTIEADSGFPKELARDVRYRTIVDSMGYQAIRIMVYLPESDEAIYLQRASEVSRRIKDLVELHGQSYIPYVSTRTVEELKELQSVGADE